MARVVLHRLCKSFGGPGGRQVRAVDGVDLTIAAGEMLVLAGPSGSGKTVTLRLVAGLERADAGKIEFDGKLVNEVPARDRDVAMVFQSQALYPHMTVEENIAFGLRVRGFPRGEIALRVEHVAELLALEECLGALPAGLSGGQRQRVALGRALVRKPALLLFDEPLSNLDPQLRSQLRTEISRLHAAVRWTAIYVTHDQTEAMTLGQNVAVMREGRIEQVGRALQLYRSPANRFVAGFLGSPSMNFLAGHIEREDAGLRFNFRDGMKGLVLPDGRAVRLGEWLGAEVILGIRPEHIRLGLQGGAPIPAGALEAEVVSVRFLGAELQVEAKVCHTTLLVRTRQDQEIKPGQAVYLSFELANAHFFDPRTERALEK